MTLRLNELTTIIACRPLYTGGEIIPASRGAIISERRGGFIGIGTLFIQRAEHRDTQAIHAKLDELLHVHGDARNDITQLDEKEPEQIEAFRDQHTRSD